MTQWVNRCDPCRQVTEQHRFGRWPYPLASTLTWMNSHHVLVWRALKEPDNPPDREPPPAEGGPPLSMVLGPLRAEGEGAGPETAAARATGMHAARYIMKMDPTSECMGVYMLGWAGSTGQCVVGHVRLHMEAYDTMSSIMLLCGCPQLLACSTRVTCCRSMTKSES
jgi:hypothetical protein